MTVPLGQVQMSRSQRDPPVQISLLAQEAPGGTKIIERKEELKKERNRKKDINMKWTFARDTLGIPQVKTLGTNAFPSYTSRPPDTSLTVSAKSTRGCWKRLWLYHCSTTHMIDSQKMISEAHLMLVLSIGLLVLIVHFGNCINCWRRQNHQSIAPHYCKGFQEGLKLTTRVSRIFPKVTSRKG